MPKTVKGALTDGPGTAVPSVKITVYGPATAETKTVKLPERIPAVMLHVGTVLINPGGDEDHSERGQVVVPEYPEPETRTVAPGPPLIGDKIKVDVTVNDTGSESPVVPVNVME
jgi:hypothetical protein